jgi:Flp pilus assembly protein TadD
MTDDPRDVRGELLRAEALIDLHRYDEAVAVLTRAISLDHDAPRSWCMLSQAQHGLGDPGEALRSAGHAVSLAPDLEWAHRLASLALSRLGRHGEAVAAAREAVRLDPGSWRGLTRLAQALVPATPDRREARVMAERARELAPLVPDTHVAVGYVEAAAGNRKGAIAAYRKALEIDPGNTVAHNELARMHLRSATAGSLAKAATGFATAVQTDPRASGSRYNLDIAVGTFLARAAGLLLLAAVIARGFGHSGTVASRLAPVALLLLPVAFVVRFVWRLTGEVRRYLWRTVVHPRSRLIAVTAEVLTVALIVVGAVVPQSARLRLFDVALACAVVSLFSPSGAQGPRRRGQPGAGSAPGLTPGPPAARAPAVPAVGTPVLWLIAAALAVLAVGAGVLAFAPGAAAGGIVVTIGSAAACAATVRVILRRSPPRVSRWRRSPP